MEEIKFESENYEFTYKKLDGNIEKCLAYIIEKLKDGQMSVMIGAGFSKNANPKYPTWAELLVSAYCQIHSKCEKTLTERKKENIKKENIKKENIKKENIKKEINKNPSRVAQEYIDMKGKREDLDIYIEDILTPIGCDKETNLALHKILLSLNWNDVITTNWDGLLEDAEGINSRYEIIKSAKDLKIKNHKRIIKINGSLRSKK